VRVDRQRRTRRILAEFGDPRSQAIVATQPDCRCKNRHSEPKAIASARSIAAVPPTHGLASTAGKRRVDLADSANRPHIPF